MAAITGIPRAGEDRPDYLDTASSRPSSTSRALPSHLMLSCRGLSCVGRRIPQEGRRGAGDDAFVVEAAGLEEGDGSELGDEVYRVGRSLRPEPLHPRQVLVWNRTVRSGCSCTHFGKKITPCSPPLARHHVHAHRGAGGSVQDSLYTSAASCTRSTAWCYELWYANEGARCQAW